MPFFINLKSKWNIVYSSLWIRPYWYQTYKNVNQQLRSFLDMEKFQQTVNYWKVYAHIVVGLHCVRVSGSHGPKLSWSNIIMVSGLLGSTVLHPIWSKYQLREDHSMCCLIRNFLKWRVHHRCYPGYLVKAFRKDFYRTRIILLDTIQNVYKT